MSKRNPPPVVSLALAAGLGLLAWFLWPRQKPTRGTVIKDTAVAIPPGPISLSIAQTARVHALMNDPNLPRTPADEALINTYMNS